MTIRKNKVLSKGLPFLLFILFTLASSVFAYAYLVQRPKEIKTGLGAIPGDVNSDGVVDIIDFQLLSNSFGKSSGQSGFNTNADFNKDNVVDILDFQVLSNSFGKTGVTNTLTPPPVSSLCQKITIPAYFYPGQLWDQAIASATTVGSMIMNPNNGPGTSKDNNYATYVNKAKAAGIRVFGYVYSSYGGRSAATVKSDIDKYRSYYGVNDIFIDETSASTSNISYYQDLANYIHTSSGASVMLNPGTVPAEGYMNVGDIIFIFENTYSAYQTAQFPPWINNYPASKFAHLVHTTTDTTSLNNAITLSRQRRAGNIYITNDILSNPWDTLPSYWQSEINLISQNCN